MNQEIYSSDGTMLAYCAKILRFKGRNHINQAWWYIEQLGGRSEVKGISCLELHETTSQKRQGPRSVEKKYAYESSSPLL